MDYKEAQDKKDVFMQTNLIEPSIEAYLEELTSQHPGIKEIWLFGSRANGSAHPESDWDFIAFADEATFRGLQRDAALHRDNLDLLIVFNTEGEFRKPWSTKKSGSLSSWEWRKRSTEVAEYRSVKWIEDKNAQAKGFENAGEIVVQRLKAYRIWPI